MLCFAHIAIKYTMAVEKTNRWLDEDGGLRLSKPRVVFDCSLIFQLGIKDYFLFYHIENMHQSLSLQHTRQRFIRQPMNAWCKDSGHCLP